MIDSEVLLRFLKSKGTDQDRKIILDWLNDPNHSAEVLMVSRKYWESLKSDIDIPEYDRRNLLNKIYQQIELDESISLLKINKVDRFKRHLIRIAAIFTIPLIFASLLLFYQNKALRKTASLVVTTGNEQSVTSEIYAPLGSRVKFCLPDSTTGMLNGGSHLTYSVPFAKDRRVRLEGEGWFDVRKDENHPFEIKAAGSTIRVLGTKFNLSAYRNENYVELVLQQGSVKFLANNAIDFINMVPSERLVSKDGIVVKSKDDPSKYSAWTEGKLVFRGDPMAEVARRIERWYNVKVILADEELEKYSFRGTFQDDKLEEVLRYLSLTSPITCHLMPREQSSDGTVGAQIVTISLKK
jgi:transmembrane sensor